MLFLTHRLHFDDQNNPAAAKSHVEVENLEGPQTGRDEQIVPVQGTVHIATSSVRKEKSLSSVVLAAVATGMLGKRFVLRLNMEHNLLVK